MTHFEQFISAVRDLPPKADLFGGDYLINPPNPNYGYHSTPLNSLTFSAMGVDGVHTAILTQDGCVRDDSPVVYVSPMDSNDCFVIAENFLSYLAVPCGITESEMAALLAEGGAPLVNLVRDKFDISPMLDDNRIETLQSLFADHTFRCRTRPMRCLAVFPTTLSVG